MDRRPLVQGIQHLAGAKPLCGMVFGCPSPWCGLTILFSKQHFSPIGARMVRRNRVLDHPQDVAVLSLDAQQDIPVIGLSW
jgi:hypothetical protein